MGTRGIPDHSPELSREENSVLTLIMLIKAYRATQELGVTQALSFLE